MNQPPFRLQRIDHVVIRAHDVEVLRRFYCEVLGCVVEKVQERIGLVQLRAGASLIDLIGRGAAADAGSNPAEARNMDHLCLRVEPFDAAAIAAHLASHGVAIDPPASRYGAEGEGPSLYLQDPEGNMIELKGPPDVPASVTRR